MAKDLKLEVIYYNQGSDIKIEFGLHGEYPLRLLTASCSNPREYLQKLKRAVSRSTIIITLGGYGDECYLPKITGLSVGRKSVVIKNSEHEISEEYGEITLPDGAIPIVMNCEFCGCVMESGAQSIIMLNENTKAVHDVLQKLIVPYIKEHYDYYKM